MNDVVVGGQPAGGPRVKAEIITYGNFCLVIGFILRVVFLRIKVEQQPVIHLMADALIAHRARTVLACDKAGLLQQVDMHQRRGLGQAKLGGDRLNVLVAVGQEG